MERSKNNLQLSGLRSVQSLDIMLIMSKTTISSQKRTKTEGNCCEKGNGKSKGGGKFQGDCRWCGVFGHRENECRKKTEWLKARGKGREAPLGIVMRVSTPQARTPLSQKLLLLPNKHGSRIPGIMARTLGPRTNNAMLRPKPAGLHGIPIQATTAGVTVQA